MKPNSQLKELVAKLAKVCWEGDSVDGCELQDWLEKAGVLTGVIADEPCGPHCRCRDADATPPWICYRITEVFK